MAEENAVPIELLRFKLTSEELQLLLQHKEEWQGASRTERRRIAERVYSNLKKKNPDWTEDDRKLKKEVSTIQSRKLSVISTKHVMLRGYIPGSTPMVGSESLWRNSRTSKSGQPGRYLE
jgi:superfamily I DNA and/or RNA helicase